MIPYENDLIPFLQDLVRIPSVNGRNPEQACAERIIAEAHKLGLSGQLVAKEVTRPNALVSWGHGDKGFAIIGHIDTVAEGDQAAWSHPPFAATIENGKLFGRGSSDNKAGIAIGLYTLALMRDQGKLDPNEVRLITAGVVDEEAGACSDLGVRHLLDQGHLPVQGAIYAYASDIVCIGHRGLLRVELTAHGKATHTGLDDWSRGDDGVNAVTGLAEILLALETLQLPYEQHPAFNHLGFTITPGTLIQGGTFVSMVPDTCKATVDMRLMPKQTEAMVLAAIDDQIKVICTKRPGLNIEVRVMNSLPAAAISADHPLATIAQQQIEAATGNRWPIQGAGPANEGYMLINSNIPTLPGFGPTGGNAHAVDEWVDVNSLGVTMQAFANIIEAYLLDIEYRFSS